MPFKRTPKSARRVFLRKVNPNLGPGQGKCYTLTRETLDSHTGFIIGVLWRYVNRARELGISKNELLTAAKGFVLRRIDKYDPSRSSATTFITKVLDTSINKWLRKMEKQQKVRPGFEGDLGTQAAWQKSPKDPARTAEYRDALRFVNTVAKGLLSPKEYRIFLEIMVKGRPDKPVAREVGYNVESLRSLRTIIRRKLFADPRLQGIIQSLGRKQRNIRGGG